MRKALLRWLAAAAVAVQAMPADAYDTGLIVPVFSGPRQLARNVSTTLYLQVWRTLRRRPTPNPRNLDFGSGIARYDPGDAFAPSSLHQIVDYTKRAEVQMTLWGSAKPLGDGVVVQAFLSVPRGVFGSGAPEMWTVGPANSAAALDLPRRSFDFSPIVLSRELIAYYRSNEGLRMCDRPLLPCHEEPVGEDWVAKEHQGEWASILATGSGRTGWLHLPSLNRMPNDASDFTAAMVAYYRHDFAQAESFFNRVANRVTEDSSTRLDARLLALIAAARDGRTNLAAFDQLSKQNPDSLYALQAFAMARFDQALRKPGGSGRAELQAAVDMVNRNRHLFSEDDPWLLGVGRLARSVER